MFRKLKFKFYLWVLSWSFVDHHIRCTEIRTHDQGFEQGKIVAFQMVAERLNLHWPDQPTDADYSKLKRAWLTNPRMVMYKFPIWPVENSDGEFVRWIYDPAQDLEKLRWVLAEIWLREGER